MRFVDQFKFNIVKFLGEREEVYASIGWNQAQGFGSRIYVSRAQGINHAEAKIDWEIQINCYLGFPHFNFCFGVIVTTSYSLLCSTPMESKSLFKL
jgi:hypothetical protein